MTHRLLAILLMLLPMSTTMAQEYSSSFNSLKLPTSTHTAALGGQNVSLIDDTPSAGWANPALYANVSDKSLALNFMTYASGSTWMGAHFTKAFGQRHTLATGVQLMNYGKMDETDEVGNVTGTFSAKDFVIGAGYSYLLTDRWSGGANLKFIFSNLADYSSIAMAVDLGVNYLDEENDLSLSASAENVGTQLKAYDDRVHTHLPFTLSLGLSKGMAHLPVRFHLTLTDLTRWKRSYYALTEEPEAGKSQKVSTSKLLLNHVVAGIDITCTDFIYLSLCYNFRRAYELKASVSSHWAGISAGAGINVKRFQFGISYAKYHQAGNSIMCTAAYRL